MSFIRTVVHRKKKYPYVDGDFIVIGPQCFTSFDESVINWKGVNYILSQPKSGVNG